MTRGTKGDDDGGSDRGVTGGSGKRKRRTAGEARRLILDAAEARLREVGPAGIRLQDVALDVGMSHPAILHHFGSREGLVNAVLARAVESLRAELVAGLGETVDAERAAELLERVFETLGDRGHARLLTWLMLTREEGSSVSSLGQDRTLLKIAETVHALRARVARPGESPALEDTLFSMMLAALAIFGEAIVGEVIQKSAGMDDRRETSARFRAWLAALLVAHLERGGRD